MPLKIMKIWVVLIILYLFVSETSLFNQNGFVVDLEYAETMGYNPNFIKYFKVMAFKYNRSYIATNHTIWFKTDPGYSLKMEIQAYKFASNEYRLFPLRFSVNVCETIAKNDFGLGEMYKCGNLTKCPITKGNYLICNWRPNSKKFPPFIPEGRYMLDIKYFMGPHEISFYRGYASIKKNNSWDSS